MAVDAFRALGEERASDPYRGLYVSPAEVDAMLAHVPGGDVAGKASALMRGRTGGRLDLLAQRAGLTTFERNALAVCLAPELDLRYERIYAFLQDDVTRKRPTADLLLKLLESVASERAAATEALGSRGRLLREGLLLLVDDAMAQAPILARAYRPDDRVVDFLAGSDAVDPRVEAFVQTHALDDLREPSLAIHAERAPRLVRLLRESTGAVHGPIVYLHGDFGTAKLAAAQAASLAAGRGCVSVDLDALIQLGGSVERSLHLAQREALLLGAVLVVDGFQRLVQPSVEGEWATARRVLRLLLDRRREPTILLGTARWEPASWFLGPERVAVREELRPITLTARADLWRTYLDGHLGELDPADMAARFRLDGEDIRAVLGAAQGRAAWHGRILPDHEDVLMSARAIAAPPLDGMARRMEARYRWDDIVVPPDVAAQLREIQGRVRHQETVLDTWGYAEKHGRSVGAVALFCGPPGTGKTMAADIVANSLGLDLYRIDLAAVVSKYIGETEKNLERIFQAADRGDAVLLFDEADALFGKRSETRDAHDRYANVETAYLLQRLETYDGLAVLTTNLRGNLDEAFLRRLDFVLEFPMPEEPERLKILERSLPPAVPMADDVDLPFLARKFRLSGGHLRNIGLAASYLAAMDGDTLTMRHMVLATRREYQKLGKLVAESDFERYYPLLKG